MNRPLLHCFRSYVVRNSRETALQKLSRTTYWPLYGLKLSDGLLEVRKCFGRMAPLFLEIGFGGGGSLIQLAARHPDKHFIGIDIYHPGIGNLLKQIVKQGIANIRLYQEDAVKILEHCILPESLDGILIFFPDPWPKRRHHQRRLIQISFVKQLITKLKPNAILHLATDWEDYARHMMMVCSSVKELANTMPLQQFAERSPYRPCITKFEQRALVAKRQIFELQFYKN